MGSTSVTKRRTPHADIAVSADDDLLDSDDNIGGTHESIGKSVAAAVNVLGLLLGDGVEFIHLDSLASAIIVVNLDSYQFCTGIGEGLT